MRLTDLKFKETDFTGRKIADLSDTPSSDGITAAELKAYFDYIPKAMIALGAVNSMIDQLCSSAGAEEIGASINGVTGINVQTVLTSLKEMIDNRYAKETVDMLLDTKAAKSVVAGMISSVDFDATTGVFTFTEQGGAVHAFDTVLEKVVINWGYDKDKQKIVLTHEDGTKQEIDLSAFISTNEFLDSDTIQFSVSGSNISAGIKNGSITESMLQTTLLDAMQGYVESCIRNAGAAAASESNAGDYAQAAKNAKTAAENAAESSTAAANEAASSAKDAANSAQEALAAEEAAKKARDEAREIVGGDYVTKEYVDENGGKINSISVNGKAQDIDDNKNVNISVPAKLSELENDENYSSVIITTDVSIQITSWVTDTTYADFPYRAAVSITDCTADYIPIITFSADDAISGNFAPVAETYDGGVYIYAAEAATVTVPSIVVIKEAEG